MVESVQPNAIQLLALLGVLGAIMWVSFPALKRLYDVLDMNPVNLTISIGAIILTVIFLVIGFLMVQDTQEQFDSRLSPEPEVINAVLPTQTSINRGATLFAEQCVGWDDDAQDFIRFVDRLDRLRDEELYFATRDGWRDLPACEGDLPSFQRWDLVNYLRTLTPLDS